MATIEPSITYWNRVEPSPCSDSLVRGLEASLRDPLWLLARQWQLGEFRGEDAASPAFVSFAAGSQSSTPGAAVMASSPHSVTRRRSKRPSKPRR